MPRDLVYLIGEPGVGKSTTMAALTSGLIRAQLHGGIARDLLARIEPGQRGAHPVAVELGRRRGAFSGTDALPMNAVVDAEAYVRSGKAATETSLLLGEGARLANARFLGAAGDAGWSVLLVHLHGEDVADERRRLRGSDQSPAWIRGARTRAARLAADPPADVRVLPLEATHAPASLAAAILTAAGRADLARAVAPPEVSHG